MQAALFLCDHVNPEYQVEFGDYTDMFGQLFPEFDFTYYDVINGEFPEDISNHDLYLCTGSRHSAYEDLAWINKTKEIIREIYRQKKYFIGFCFGHQLLGESLGGQVKKSPNGWCVGVHEFKVLDQQAWMQPNTKQINLLMMCQDQVVVPPVNSKILIGNDLCPVGMIQVENTMLGIQAHPEFSKEYDQLLMQLRGEKIGPQTVKTGIKSLTKDVNRELIKNWILNFINA